MRADKNYRLKILFCLVLLIGAAKIFGQEKVLMRMKDFHALLITPGPAIDGFIDDSLTYGHSNGWVESRMEFKKNLGSKLVYHAIPEDSLDVKVNKRMAWIRFHTDIDVTLNGNRAVYKLKVLEVWVKRGSRWKLFARQAVKR